MRCYLFAALFICVIFGPVQSVPMSAGLRNVKAWLCLKSLNYTAETMGFLNDYYEANCFDGPKTSAMCDLVYYVKERFPFEKDTVSYFPQNREIPSFSDSSTSAYNPDGYPLILNAYNLLEIHPFVKVLKCVEPNFDSDTLYHTSISYREDEYHYGADGVVRVPDGQSSFGSIREQVLLRYTNKPRDEMRDFVRTTTKLYEFTPKKYDLFSFNCHNFTNEVSLVLSNKPIDPSYQRTITKLADSPLGGWIELYQDKLKFTLI